MAKASGLGDLFLVGGNDLSGDTNSLGGIKSPTAVFDVTGINQLAFNRIAGLRDGDWSWVSYFNPTGAHPVLAALPTADVGLMYLRGSALGAPACCCVAKQIDYNPTRAAGGMLTFAVAAQANGFGNEWGKTLTAGKRTDTAATNGTAVDGLASSAFGLQAYLQVSAFTGTDVTVKLQDSADNVTFADLSGAAFAQITSGTPQSQRIAISNSATVRRYLRASTVTTGGVTGVTYAVVYNRNPIAGTVF